VNSPLPPLPKLFKHPLISKDLDNLKSRKLQLIALNLVEQLMHGSIRGKRLENQEGVGDLSDFFKIYFDIDKERPPRYRIVYRYLPNSDAPTELQLLVIATRENLKVYKEAVKRMKELTSDG
jgi:hypothetical protein